MRSDQTDGATHAPTNDRARGAYLGALIGDALAMPAHWYYDTAELRETFGTIDRYLPPPAVHPGSILWRSRYDPTEPEFDILGEQRRYWGRRGVHYHQFLAAGENTLNLKLVRLALALVDADGRYDRSRFIDAYLRFMREPAGHRDTYVEECHRGFFENLRAGTPPDRAAVVEKHIGGMVAVVPLYARLRTLGDSDSAARRTVQDHVAVTHAGSHVADAVATLLQIAAEVYDGDALRAVLERHLAAQDLPYLRGPIARHAASAPERILGRVYSTACYLDHAMPATFYLALRFIDAPRDALIANTMAGGDNCHRGAVLGALYGLDRGTDPFPEEWQRGLVGADVPA